MLEIVPKEEEKPKDVLRTTCKGCVFDFGTVHHPECGFHKVVSYDKEQQYTDGFCRYKRNKKWFDKYTDNHTNSLSLENVINYENNKLSVVIIHLNNTVEQLEKTIKSLLCYEIVKEVIVISKEETDDGQKEILSTFYDKGWHWQYQNMLGLEKLNDNEESIWFQMLEFGVGLVKNPWILDIRSGEIVADGMLTNLNNKLNDINTNYVYFKHKDTGQLLFSYDCFKAMDGHKDFPWSEKISQFSNASEVVCNL